MITKKEYEHLKREHNVVYSCRDGGCWECDDIEEYESKLLNKLKVKNNEM